MTSAARDPQPGAVELLIARYLEGALSGAEEGCLLEAIERDPGIAAHIAEHLRLHEALRESLLTEASGNALARAVEERLKRMGQTGRFTHEVVERLKSESGAGRSHNDTDSVPPQEPPRIEPRPPTARKNAPPTRRTLRSPSSPQNPSWGVLAVAAAGILAAAALFLALGPSEKDPISSQRAQEAHARASKEAEARRQADRDRQEGDRAHGQAEAEAKRLEAEARLREIEEKRRILSQVKPELSDPSAEKEKREKELADLKRDKERIEQELREAALLAKKTERAAPAAPPQEEKPVSPAAAPATSSQGSTRSALAKVEEVSGEAFVVTKEGKAPLAAGTDVFSGAGLQTGGGTSRIVLRFPDRTRVDLGPDTLLAELKTDSGKRLELIQGTLRAVVAKQPKGEPLVFTTPYGEAKVLGTTLRLYADPDPKKGTKLEVEEGKVELKNLAGKTVYVESGHYAVAAVGVELVARVLPSRPRPAGYVARIGQTPWGAILQTVSLVPNQTYTLSVWIQTSTPDPEKMTGQFPGGSIGVRTESGSILAQQPFGQSESYVRTVLTFKSGSNNKAVIFAGLANGTNALAWIHVDDWSLTEKGGDGTNLVQDPDYEGQNPAGGLLSGPWFTEGPSRNNSALMIGVDPDLGRLPKGSSGGERK